MKEVINNLLNDSEINRTELFEAINQYIILVQRAKMNPSYSKETECQIDSKITNTPLVNRGVPIKMRRPQHKDKEDRQTKQIMPTSQKIEDFKSDYDTKQANGFQREILKVNALTGTITDIVEESKRNEVNEPSCQLIGN